MDSGMDNKPKIQVLLSSYNGEQYIRKQIDSILQQSNVDVHCLVRDDGSKDNTNTILEEYASLHKLEHISGENVGFAKSFYTLVADSGDYDYFAFSDQDDVWISDKIETAITAIHEHANIPQMYFSNCDLVDGDLHHIGYMYEDIKMSDRKFDRLIDNRAAGCTIVFNKAARDYFLKGRIEKIQFHDFWVFVLCSYFGNVVYDPQCKVLYRQHQNNEVGNHLSFMKIWKQRIKQLKKKGFHVREYIAQELLRNFAELLTEDEKNELQLIAEYRQSLRKRLRLLFSGKIHMNSFKKKFWFRIHTIVGNV